MKRWLRRRIYGPNYLIFYATYPLALWILFFIGCGFAGYFAAYHARDVWFFLKAI